MLCPHRRRPRRGFAASIAAVALLAGACGSGDTAAPPSTVATPTTSPAAVSSTTTTAISTTSTVPDEPLSVLLAGDSLARDIAPGTRAALDAATEDVDFHFEVFPIVPRLAEQYAEWNALVAATDPDVVLMYIGVWEAMNAGAIEPIFGEPGFADSYREQVLAPWFDSLQDLGIHTIFLGMASILGEADGPIQLTVDATEAEASARDEVDFLRTGDALSPDGFVAVLPDSRTGVLERVRRDDGRHLCPDGAERVVDLVLDRLRLVAELTIDDSWRDGPWREDSPVDLSVECPPVP